MAWLRKGLTILCIWLMAAPVEAQSPGTLVIGGKNFNEGSLLAEIMAQMLEAHGFDVERRFRLGGTMVCFSALKNGEIDAYPEYSGTIAQAILKLPRSVSFDSLNQLLVNEYRMQMLPGFGFNNTYALAMPRALAERLQIHNISDLRRHPELSLGFSLEFLNRHDGWIGLRRHYHLPQRPQGLEHGLAYMALQRGEIDLTDAYSTDGDIPRYDLVLLQDDRGFFPTYLAVPLIRLDLPAEARQALLRLANRLDENQMQRLNARIVVEKQAPTAVASDFLRSENLITGDGPAQETFWSLLARRTWRHLLLSSIALFMAMTIAIPTGMVTFRFRRFARLLTYLAGLLQTIPSIALLAFMIPLFGIGVVPAIVALFLYSLLPILRNTLIALFSVDPLLKKVATGMGMSPWQRMRFIELPLASPTILAGIKTAAVINIGTATLAAFIGAGGLGEPIVTGLTLNDTGLILQGAIPAALLAIAVELIFEFTERFLIPAHLRQYPSP
ncbi:MAG: glycine betaine ABC transporter substrate-binding protein [candidate division KSB1 bacterium]|nr:glycine betaine ABC transporter substrate-binding protein [candidate division KSB1 bacterium]